MLYPLSYGSKASSGLLVGSHKLLRETTRNRRRRADLVLETGLTGPQKTSEPSQASAERTETVVHLLRSRICLPRFLNDQAFTFAGCVNVDAPLFAPTDTDAALLS